MTSRNGSGFSDPSTSPTRTTTARNRSVIGSCGIFPAGTRRNTPTRTGRRLLLWMTPNRDWRSEYANWPEALAKLEYCDQRMKDLSERDPVVTDDARDEDVGDLE